VLGDGTDDLVLVRTEKLRRYYMSAFLVRIPLFPALSVCGVHTSKINGMWTELYCTVLRGADLLLGL
jgi:hypothetical protein